LLCRAPNMVADEIDVFPAKRGQMSQQLDRDAFSPTRDGDGVFEIPGIPENDRGDKELQTRGAMLLVLIGAITNFTAPANKERPRQAAT